MFKTVLNVTVAVVVSVLLMASGVVIHQGMQEGNRLAYAAGTKGYGASPVLSSDTITCTSDAGTASTTRTVSYIVTDGGADTNEDTVSLADGQSGQVKYFVYKTETDAGDSANVTPSNFANGSKIVFDAPGEGCVMIFDGTNWSLISHYGGSIS